MRIVPGLSMAVAKAHASGTPALQVDDDDVSSGFSICPETPFLDF